MAWIQGIVIEFSDDSGLIKCTQNPQLYFHMSEVIEKKKLELNEKVEFSVVPVSSSSLCSLPVLVLACDQPGEDVPCGLSLMCFVALEYFCVPRNLAKDKMLQVPKVMN